MRSVQLVDYQQLVKLKRQLLTMVAATIFDGASPRRADLETFLAMKPQAAEYARFRAVCEQHHGGPYSWPAELQGRGLLPEDCDSQAERYHLYAQLLAEEQIAHLSRRARADGLTWYLDLPLGSNGDGYDVWAYRDCFVTGLSGGAPPDPMFTKGQCWGFPPLHPEGIREQGYGYLIDVVRHHLRHAGLLRIDHVMSLHRLFCIPNSMDSRHGVYLKYRDAELYAVLSLESHRAQAEIVGENLGTVPQHVDAAMSRHGLQRMYVLQYELQPDYGRALAQPPRHSIASLNTHDMSPWSGFWQDLDMQDLNRQGLLEGEKYDDALAGRVKARSALITFLRDRGLLDADADDAASLREACLLFLAQSPASLVLVNLEDLWMATEPQNVPGTLYERPNWRRRAPYTLEEITARPEFRELLTKVNQARNTRGSRSVLRPRSALRKAAAGRRQADQPLRGR